MAAAPDDKIYVNVIKEGTEIQQTLDAQRDKFEFINRIGITKNHFLDDLERYKPNILHFSGHGTEYASLVFQDGDELSSEQLEKTFQSLPFKISLVFLNSCYSKKQANTISKYVDHIIGMKKDVSDDAAIIFSSQFYKSLLKNIDYKEAYEDAIAYLSYYLESESNIPKLIVTHGLKSITKIISQPNTLSTTTLIESSSHNEENEIIVQNLPVAIDLLLQIEKTIRIYEEKSINDKFDFKNFWLDEKDGNLYGILIILINNSSEYGIDEDQLHLIRKTLRKVTEIIHKLDNDDEEYRNLIKSYFNDIINQVLRKIYFNYKVDSIQKIQPLFPKIITSNRNNNILSNIMDTYNYLEQLKEQIEYSIITHNNNNKLFLLHSITQCYSILHIFNIKYKALTKALKFISEISTSSYFSIQSLFSNLQTSLINYHDISELQKSKNIILEIEKTINELFYKYIQFIHLFMS
jgi:tetratricopeptide (TPR) repeat protein